MRSLGRLKVDVNHNYFLACPYWAEVLFIKVVLPLFELLSALIHHVLEPFKVLLAADVWVCEAWLPRYGQSENLEFRQAVGIDDTDAWPNQEHEV
jgi:hypothetical protein